MDEPNHEPLIRKTAEELLGQLGVGAAVAVAENPEGGCRVDLSGQDLGILIGFHGETLSSLQLILNLMVHQRLGEWRRILVDVEGYRREREAKLTDLAKRSADRVRFLRSPVTLSPMPPFERRLVHLALQEDESVVTESVGERWERRVVVKPRIS